MITLCMRMTSSCVTCSNVILWKDEKSNIESSLGKIADLHMRIGRTTLLVLDRML